MPLNNYLQVLSNPFNTTTIIRYSVSENGKLKIENSMVTLKVYNILGKEIATLVNERQKPGIYEVQFSDNQIPSGIYFYRLLVDDVQFGVKKMILIK